MANIQITIDDGPLDESSLESMLAELKKRKLIAAFFILGQEIKDDGKNLKKIIDAGHILGNHTWDHLPEEKYTQAMLLAQFKKTHDRVKAVIDYEMLYWRTPRLYPPYTQLVTPVMVGEGKLYQMTHCDNHLDTEDALGSNTAAKMLKHVADSFATYPNRTNYRILFHVLKDTAAVWSDVLDDLEKQGHTLVNFKQTT